MRLQTLTPLEQAVSGMIGEMDFQLGYEACNHFGHSYARVMLDGALKDMIRRFSFCSKLQFNTRFEQLFVCRTVQGRKATWLHLSFWCLVFGIMGLGISTDNYNG
jgi:hypothetical protein